PRAPATGRGRGDPSRGRGAAAGGRAARGVPVAGLKLGASPPVANAAPGKGCALPRRPRFGWSRSPAGGKTASSLPDRRRPVHGHRNVTTRPSPAPTFGSGGGDPMLQSTVGSCG